VKIRSIMCRIVFAKAATTTLESPMRFMIVYDKQTNAATPTVAAILQSDNIFGLQNLDNSNRFVVIMDKTFRFGSVDQTSVVYSKYKKVNLPVQFNTGSAGTVGDIQTGGLFLVTWSPQITTALPIGSCTTRIRFSDN